jgi:hypothetical protein
MSSRFDFTKIEQMSHPGITRMTKDILGHSGGHSGDFHLQCSDKSAKNSTPRLHVAFIAYCTPASIYTSALS